MLTFEQTVLQSLVFAQEAFLSALQAIVKQSIARKQDYQQSTSTAEASEMQQIPSLQQQQALSSLTSSIHDALRLFDVPVPERQRSPSDLETLNDALSKLLPFLPAKDRQIATSLMDLLSCIDRLLSTSPGSTAASTPVRLRGSSSIDHMENLYDTLQQDASSFRSGSKPAIEASSALREVEKAEQDLLWGRIEDLLEQVSAVCKSPAERPLSHDSLPVPQYEASLSEYSLSDLPVYSSDKRLSNDLAFPPEYKLDEKAALGASVNSRFSAATDEKRQIELEGISEAIERLYSVSPQLANQRVDPGRTDRKQIREMQLARLTGAIERLSKGRLEDQRAILPTLAPNRNKGKQKSESISKQEELDQLLEAIGKGANADMTNQRVALRCALAPFDSICLIEVCWRTVLGSKRSSQMHIALLKIR
jgi:hypothetical protein